MASLYFVVRHSFGKNHCIEHTVTDFRAVKKFIDSMDKRGEKYWVGGYDDTADQLHETWCSGITSRKAMSKIPTGSAHAYYSYGTYGREDDDGFFDNGDRRQLYSRKRKGGW